MKTPKFSIGSWAFSFGPFEKDPWSFDRFLQYAQNAGYDGIEINGFHPHPHPDVYHSKSKCIELLKSIQGYGLGISGYAPDFRSVPAARVETDIFLKEAEKSIQFCHYMGIDILRVDTISPPDEMEAEIYKSRFNQLVKTWRKTAEACKKDGITLVWEFEPGFWLNKPSEVKMLVDAINHSHFKVLFDTSHAYMGAVIGARQTGEKEILEKGVVEYAHLLSGQIGHFHLIDSDGSLHDHETSTHSPFGTGNINFKEVISALLPDVEYLEWWCFDFCFCPTTEEDAVKAIPFVRNIIDEL